MPRTTRRLRLQKQKGGDDYEFQGVEPWASNINVNIPLVPSYSPKLYMEQDQFTPETIEKIMCNGRTLADLPHPENPIYVLKWGPPGSGKSSKKVIDFIKTLGVPLEDYVDYSTDKLIESYVPYRVKSTIAKLKHEQMKGFFITKNYRVIRSFLQEMGEKYGKSSVEKTSRGTLQSTKADYYFKDWNPTKINLQKDQLDKILDRILYDALYTEYSSARDKELNNNKKNLYSKMVEFMKKSLTSNANIIYETLGAGYQMVREPIPVKNQFVSGQGVAFKNHWEPWLGRIKFNQDGIPTIDRTSFGSETVPINYRIFVVYPLLDKNEITRRAYTRALLSLSDIKKQNVEDIDTYRSFLLTYAKLLYAALQPHSDDGKLTSVEQIVDYAIQQEYLDYTGKDLILPGELTVESSTVVSSAAARTPTGYNVPPIPNTSSQTRLTEPNKSYTKYLKSLISEFETADQVSIPFFRAVSPDAIYSMLKQSFNYSVDYFLKQYILAGRIEQVVYINNRDVYKSKLFLDMDGVFADFETRFQEVLATKAVSPQQEKQMTPMQRWNTLMKVDADIIEPENGFFEANNAHFFDNLGLMPGAEKLWDAVNDFIFRSGQKVPVFLTGCPISPFRQWAEEGKMAWVQNYFLKQGGRILRISVPEKESDVAIKALHQQLKEAETAAGINDIIMIFCRPEQKQIFSTVEPRPILIDDRTDAGPQWMAVKNADPMFIHHKFNPSPLGKRDKRYRNALSESAVTRSVTTLRRLYGGKRKGHKTRRA